MNTVHFLQNLRARMRHGLWLVSALALWVLTGCASSGLCLKRAVPQAGIRSPAPCSSSCQVSLQMPPGSGTYEVTGNETKIGDFPAGETVSLGSLWASNAIKVVGANVPAAYVYIPSQP